MFVFLVIILTNHQKCDRLVLLCSVNQIKHILIKILYFTEPYNALKGKRKLIRIFQDKRKQHRITL